MTDEVLDEAKVKAAWAVPKTDEVADAGWVGICRFTGMDGEDEDVTLITLDPAFPPPDEGAVLMFNTPELLEALAGRA